jgi:hypothetical protein
MKKAYDYNVRDLWIVNVGDIKPAEIGIEYFMQMAWDISAFKENNPVGFLIDWASRDFGKEYASRIAAVMTKHYELGYQHRPESMVMYKGRTKKYTYNWFSITNYNDEAQKRVDEYDKLIKETDEIYNSLPVEMKDSFFQTVAYNVKGAGLHNKKAIYAQKSHAYGQQNRASAAVYAAKARQAENDIKELINHYNTEQVTVGDKWNHMASLPGPWGMQWQQFAMPPLSDYPGNGNPQMKIATEGGDTTIIPGFSVYNEDKRFIDLYNTGNGVVYWSSSTSGEWMNWNGMSESEREEYKTGAITNKGPGSFFNINLSVFNPLKPSAESVTGFVESNGYISIEAEHYSRKVDKPNASWNIIEGLGRTGNSITVLPTNIDSNVSLDDIISKSPVLEYDLYIFTEDEATIHFNCTPSNPINADHGLRLAAAVDDAKPIIVSPAVGEVMLSTTL